MAKIYLEFISGEDMEYYRKNWYLVGGGLFVAVGVLLVFIWGSIDMVQRLLVMSFMALLVHQFEEYFLPGGFPGIFNIAVAGEREAPERYPLNQNKSLIVNVFCAYTFYIAAIIFPQLYWLGIANMLFGMAQIIFHGIVVNVKLKCLYNPGLGSVVLLHFPIGVYYLWYVSSNGLIETSDVIWGIVATIAAALLMVAAPIKLLGNKQSKYPFEEAELFRIDKAKLRKMLQKTT